MQKTYKALKLYFPERKNFGEFEKIIDYAEYLGYNTIVLEVGGAMEYKKHPEINEAWIEYSNRFKDVPGSSIVFQNSFDFPKNSIHWENGGGSYLSQEEVKSLIRYCKEKGMEVIPEVPLLSHSDYLLLAHKEFAENEEDPCPDAYCPSNEEVYKLVFDVLDEVLDVFQPKIVHIGHDEYLSICLCEKCKDKSAADLFAGDIIRIHDYLAERNVRTMMWGDKLLACVDNIGSSWGGARVVWFDAKTLKIPTRVIPATCTAIDKIPKDVIIMHWFSAFGEYTTEAFLSRGFDTWIGNYAPTSLVLSKENRRQLKGFCVSSWGTVDRLHFQRGGIFYNMTYSVVADIKEEMSEEEYAENVLKTFDKAYRYFNAKTLSEKHIEICHNTDEFIAHEAFVDGNYIELEETRLGTYEIVFTDGTTQEIPVYYNYNIGNADRDLKRGKWNLRNACHATSAQLSEAAGTCNLRFVDGKAYYTIVVPTKGESIASYSFKPQNHHSVNTLYVKLEN